MRNWPLHNNGNIVLFPSNRFDSCLLIIESRNTVMLDSGYSSTVSGRFWMDRFSETLSSSSNENYNVLQDITCFILYEERLNP